MRKEVLSYLSSFVTGALDFDIYAAAAGTMFFAVMRYMVGEYDFALNLFAYSLAADYITGWIKAIIKKEVHSNTGYKGLLKKGGMVLIVGLGFQLDKAAGTEFIRTIFISGYVGNEIGSIAENCESIGLLPKGVSKFLKQYQDKLSKIQLFK